MEDFWRIRLKTNSSPYYTTPAGTKRHAQGSTPRQPHEPHPPRKLAQSPTSLEIKHLLEPIPYRGELRLGGRLVLLDKRAVHLELRLSAGRADGDPGAVGILVLRIGDDGAAIALLLAEEKVIRGIRALVGDFIADSAMYLKEQNLTVRIPLSI